MHYNKKRLPKSTATEGSILKSLFSVSFPIILANILQTMYQLIDTFWLGRLGANAVAAVSISFPILFLVLSLGGGLTLAGTVIVAQYKGAARQDQVNYSSSQAVIVIFLLSVLLSVFSYFMAEPLMKIIGTGPEIMDDAVAYFRISSLGFVFLFMFFVFQSLMRGIGNVLLPMYIVIGTVFLNLVLDPLFIFGFGPIPPSGVAGAAIASVITQGISAAAGIWILFKGGRGVKVSWNEMRLNWDWIKRLFRLGLPASMEQSARAAAMTMMVIIVASFGSEIVAAYGVGTRMLSLIVVPALGLSIGTTTLVGQNIGAGQIKRAEKVANLSNKIAFYGLTLVGLIMFLIAEPLTTLFIPNDPQVIKDGTLFIKIMAPAFGLMGVQQVLNGTFNGAGFTKASMLISILGLWIIRFPLAYILSYNTSLEHIGIWMAFPISNLVAAIVAFTYYKFGHWKKRVIMYRHDRTVL